jgi:serine/threonine protein kinase
MIAQLRETPSSIVLKGLLGLQSVPVLVENTRASPTHTIVSTSVADDLEMSGHCPCPNILMVPTLMMSTATGELYLVYPWYPEFTLVRVLARENFRFPLGCVECYGCQMASALKTMKQINVAHTNISADTWLLTRKSEFRLFDFSHEQKSGTVRREFFMAASHRRIPHEYLAQSGSGHVDAGLP